MPKVVPPDTPKAEGDWKAPAPNVDPPNEDLLKDVFDVGGGVAGIGEVSFSAEGAETMASSFCVRMSLAADIP